MEEDHVVGQYSDLVVAHLVRVAREPILTVGPPCLLAGWQTAAVFSKRTPARSTARLPHCFHCSSKWL